MSNRFAVEALEVRQFFSANPAAVVHEPYRKVPPTEVSASLSKGGTLYVAGTAGNDGIVVVQSGRYITAARTRKGGKLMPIFSARSNRVEVVMVDARGGNDYVNTNGVFRPCVIAGGAGNDFIHGSDYDDAISGDDGDDEVHTHDGDDTVDGGAGNDGLQGQQGDDVLIGGPGADHLYGDWGDDRLLSRDGAATDHVHGGSGRDECTADLDPAFPDYEEWESSPFATNDIEDIHT
jgi:Ca2+-binding RTX toxin-like protein